VLVVIIEDDDAIAEPLAKGLTREGYDVERFERGEPALHRLQVDDADPAPAVVLLDLGLPDVDGFELCRRLRAESDVPIIVVTARGEEADRVVGLELGADDYIVKPFGFRELVARIRAVSRRLQHGGVEVASVRVDDLEIDPRTRRVTLAGEEIPLTPKEFDLLALLADDPGAVWSRTRILEEVWEPHWYGPTKTLDVHVASLRKKLGDPGWIETVRGVGFRLRAPE
jgi:two-component system, OmpR family, response regulator RegX3